MKLAFIVNGGFHPSGRQEVIPGYVALLERLTRRHEVHAFALRHLDEPSTYTLRGITVHDLGRPGARGVVKRWAEWRALASALAAAGPFDVFHGMWADPAGFLAALAGRRFGRPSVVSCDSGEFVALEDIDYGSQRTTRGRAIVRLACQFSTRVHVATEYQEGLAAEHVDGAVRIPIGVDLPRLPAPPHRVDGPPWKLLQVATLSRVKDQATLLDVVAALGRDVDVHLNLVGEDSLHGALQVRAAELGIGNRVTFHGFRAFDELSPFYQAAHLYVQSSRHEAAGAAVMEAAASGLPVVGTRVGYVADWAGDGSVAVEPGNAAALAQAVAETLADRRLRERIAAHARAFAKTHEVDWTARELTRLYASFSKAEPADSGDITV